VAMYKEALELILDVEPEEDEEDEDEDEEDEDEDEMLGDEQRPVGYRRASDRRHTRMASDVSVIESSAELLYGLIHQRYITSRPGIQQMLEKYELQHFGHCPRVNCNAAKVLPVGCSDTPGQDTVKLFCPSCLDIYTPPNSRFQTVDGAFFGTTFGCLFFMTFPELEIGMARSSSDTLIAIAGSAANADLSNASRTGSSSSAMLTPSSSNKPIRPQPSTINGIATANLAPGLGDGNIYEPKIYGFKVSDRARSGPRMKWLREKPYDINELDEARRYIEERDPQAGEDGEGEEEMPDATPQARRKIAARRRRGVNGVGGGPMEMDKIGDGG